MSARKTESYLDYLDQQAPIAPANSQEELQAADAIAKVMSSHGLEPKMEEFVASAAAGSVRSVLRLLLFVALLVSQVPSFAVSVVCVLVGIVAAGLLIADAMGYGVITQNTPPVRSQNVVAVHRATGDLVSKGNRPIVIVAHYDTGRESLLKKMGLGPVMPLLAQGAFWGLFVGLVALVLQPFGVLGVARTVLFALGVIALIPSLLMGIEGIYRRFAPCTAGANNNKSSIAALLAVLNKVRPNDNDLDAWYERRAQNAPANVRPEPAVNPERAQRPRPTAPKPHYEEVEGVRHGKAVLEQLQILPADCEIEYVAPRLVVSASASHLPEEQDGQEEQDAHELSQAQEFAQSDAMAPEASAASGQDFAEPSAETNEAVSTEIVDDEPEDAALKESAPEVGEAQVDAASVLPQEVQAQQEPEEHEGVAPKPDVAAGKVAEDELPIATYTHADEVPEAVVEHERVSDVAEVEPLPSVAEADVDTKGGSSWPEDEAETEDAPAAEDAAPIAAYTSLAEDEPYVPTNTYEPTNTGAGQVSDVAGQAAQVGANVAQAASRFGKKLRTLLSKTDKTDSHEFSQSKRAAMLPVSDTAADFEPVSDEDQESAVSENDVTIDMRIPQIEDRQAAPARIPTGDVTNVPSAHRDLSDLPLPEPLPQTSDEFDVVPKAAFAQIDQITEPQDEAHVTAAPLEPPSTEEVVPEAVTEPLEQTLPEADYEVPEVADVEDSSTQPRDLDGEDFKDTAAEEQIPEIETTSDTQQTEKSVPMAAFEVLEEPDVPTADPELSESVVIEEPELDTDLPAEDESSSNLVSTDTEDVPSAEENHDTEDTFEPIPDWLNSLAAEARPTEAEQNSTIEDSETAVAEDKIEPEQEKSEEVPEPEPLPTASFVQLDDEVGEQPEEQQPETENELEPAGEKNSSSDKSDNIVTPKAMPSPFEEETSDSEAMYITSEFPVITPEQLEAVSEESDTDSSETEQVQKTPKVSPEITAQFVVIEGDLGKADPAITQRIPVQKEDPAEDVQEKADSVELPTAEFEVLDSSDDEETGYGDGDMSGLTKFGTVDPNGQGKDPERTVPPLPEDPEWGKSSFKPQSTPARRASLFDLPDPSETEQDPFAVDDSADITAPTMKKLSNLPVISDEPLKSDTPQPRRTIRTSAPVAPLHHLDDANSSRRTSGKQANKDEKREHAKKRHLFGKRQKQEEDSSMSSWLGLEDDYDARRDGREIGSWKNFDDDDPKWKGGAAVNSPYRTIDIDMSEGVPSEEELKDAILSMGDDELIAHDIWFVALGASEYDHAGMEAFLAEHRKSCRGSFVVNLDSIGAGDLTLLSEEGVYNKRKADRRLTRLLSSIAADLKIPLGIRSHTWEETDVTKAMRASMRSVTIMGCQHNGDRALSETPDDVYEEVDVNQINDVVRMVCELIRRS